MSDIFVNAKSYDDIARSAIYNNELTGGAYFKGIVHFNYNYIVKNPNFIINLLRWLNTLINECWFEFTKPYYYDPQTISEIDNKKYIRFVDWWKQVKHLKLLLTNELRSSESKG